ESVATVGVRSTALPEIRAVTLAGSAAHAKTALAVAGTRATAWSAGANSADALQARTTVVRLRAGERVSGTPLADRSVADRAVAALGKIWPACALERDADRHAHADVAFESRATIGVVVASFVLRTAAGLTSERVREGLLVEPRCRTSEMSATL